jgi:pseudouridine-5'-phosphate glycosidase
VTASLAVHPEVREALAAGRPVVALESAVITCGLPAVALDRTPEGCEGWDPRGPLNLQTAGLLERTVRSRGAVPATVAILDGVLRVGLEPRHLERLAAEPGRPKATVRDAAAAIAAGATAGTTVSATLMACRLAGEPHIRVLATGGIGGIHRGWTAVPDVSADLPELARAAVCVVCSGIKSLLDAPATLEALETLGIPLFAFRTGELPGFYARNVGASGPQARVDDATAVARLCRAHWETLRRPGAVVVANPVPAGAALGAAELERIVAEAEAATANARGPGRTPAILQELGRRSGGRALEANVALLRSNASLAAEIAAALAAP